MTKAPDDLSELDMLIQARDLEEKFLEAKKTLKRDDPKRVAIAEEFHKNRTYWRQIRDAVAGGSVPTSESKVKDS